MMSANKEGVIKGYDNGYFYPENSLSRGQMALILARALQVDKYPVTDEPYPFKDVMEGKEIHTPVTNLAELGIITKQEHYRPAEPINRAQFAAMINRTHQYLQNKPR
jgi:minor extracellular protease Epr